MAPVSAVFLAVLAVLAIVAFYVYRVLTTPNPSNFLFMQNVRSKAAQLTCPTATPHIKIQSAYFGVPGATPDDCTPTDVTAALDQKISGASTWVWPGDYTGVKDPCLGRAKALYGTYSCNA
jgi:hypothetical protein